MKIMFLDESGDHSLDKVDNSYPMFVLAGCIFDFDYYTNIVESELRKLKLKHFGKDDVILRSYDIRKQKKTRPLPISKRKSTKIHEELAILITG